MGPGNGHDDMPLGEPPEEVPEDGDALFEDLDDDALASLGPIPDPLDRIWLHPSELAAIGGAFAPGRGAGSVGGPRRRSLLWLTPLLAGAAGALLTVGVLALTGTFDRTAATDTGAESGTAVKQAATVADTLSRLSPSVVAVVATDAAGTRRGSGVCVRHGAQLLTSTRVVGNAKTVQIVTADGRTQTARVAGRDSVTSLVLLDLDGSADVPAAALSDAKPSPGSAVWLLGAGATPEKSPWMSGGMTSSNNAIVASDRGPTAAGLIATDAASATAAVGGALVDGEGSVAGIVLGHVNGSSTTYAVSITVAVGVARQLDATGVASHGSLGVSGVDTAAGPMISKMTSTAPAARAGLHVRDVVKSVDGRPVESMGEVTAIVQSLAPGSTVALDLRRGTHTMQVRARLGSMPG